MMAKVEIIHLQKQRKAIPPGNELPGFLALFFIEWFANLLENHLEGILNHAKYHIGTSKLEGINNMSKTVRRTGYGYPDDEYFFLRLFDASRKKSRFS